MTRSKKVEFEAFEQMFRYEITNDTKVTIERYEPILRRYIYYMSCTVAAEEFSIPKLIHIIDVTSDL